MSATTTTRITANPKKIWKHVRALRTPIYDTLPRPQPKLTKDPGRWTGRRVKLRAVQSTLVIMTICYFAGGYFDLTQLFDFTDRLQHRIIPWERFHEYLRDVVPGILALYIVRRVTWNHYRKMFPPGPLEKLATRLGIPTLRDNKPGSKRQTLVVLLASGLILAIVFPPVYWAVMSINDNANDWPRLMSILRPSQATVESAPPVKLWAGMTVNWHVKAIGFITGVMISWPARGEYDDNQTYAAQRLVNYTLRAELAGKAKLHWYTHVVFWLLPPFHDRYTELLTKAHTYADNNCGETEESVATKRTETWWRRPLKWALVIQFIYFTAKGAYVLIFIRYDQDPLGISPVSLGWRKSLRD